MSFEKPGDDNVVQFPKTAEERRALRKAKEALEKQRLINVFIDEAGGRNMEDVLNVVADATGIKSTKKLSDELRRLMPALRTVGVHVVFEQRRAEYRGLRIETRRAGGSVSQ